MNRRAKCDTTSFILGGEIRIHTNTSTRKTHRQTVNDISTPCLSACVDKNIARISYTMFTCELESVHDQ